VLFVVCMWCAVHSGSIEGDSLVASYRAIIVQTLRPRSVEKRDLNRRSFTFWGR
jgi:hypothetical protein